MSRALDPGPATELKASSSPCGEMAARRPGWRTAARIRKKYTSGHGDGSGDRYGCREPLPITGRAVSALLLHPRRRVVVRRAVNY
jgi:hypothetical protein